MRRIFTAAFLFFGSLSQAHAWGSRGHELVAYLAYLHLDASVKTKVDALVQLNPCHTEWNNAVSALPVSQQKAALFMLAATWPDKIKPSSSPQYPAYDCQPDLTFLATDGVMGANHRINVDVAPNVPEASQNIGYQDNRRHQYWHFIDTPLAAPGVSTVPAGSVNVLTELQLLSAALTTTAMQANPSLASYDLVWIEHLTGDIHQPLHDTQRFSAAFPDGDAGGNGVKICSGTSGCKSSLHSFWDELPGSEGSLTVVMSQGDTLNQQPAPSAAQINLDHPEKWVDDAFALAGADAYAAPFTPDETQVKATDISAGYRSTAKEDMNKQVFIAGYRLAALLNRSLH